MNEIPEPWRTAAERAGLRTTLRGLADASGVSHVTVGRLIDEGRSSAGTIKRVADALRVDVDTVRDWAGIETSDWGTWDPPAEAHKLNPRARAALDELIRAIVQGEDSAGTTDKKRPRGGPDAGGTAAKPKPKRPDSGGSVTEVDFGGGGLEELAADRQDGPSAYQDQARRQDAAGTENQDS